MLARLHVRATFFALGSAMQIHPELIARQIVEGHEAGTHDWMHTGIYGMAFPELSDSVDRTYEVITAAGTPSPCLWRPLYGRVDVPAMVAASLRRVDLLLWNVHTPSVAAADVAKGATGAGSVVLYHDGRTQPSEGLFSVLEGGLYSLLERELAVTTGSNLPAPA